MHFGYNRIFIKTCGLQYLIKNKMSDTGDPQVFPLNIKENEETTIVSMNLHDLEKFIINMK